jgi:hypothetical protein
MEKHKEFQWVSDSNKTDKSVAAPKPDPKELIADNPKTYTHFDMLATVARQTKHLFEVNEALSESIKELLPLAETELGNTINVFDMERYKSIISRAKALLDKH